MPKYLISGTEPGGRKTTALVEATDTDAAVRSAGERGLTEIVLHSDEVIGHLFKPEAAAHLTPREMLVLGRVGRGRFMLLTIGMIYRRQWWLYGLITFYLVGRRAMEEPWEIYDSLAVAMFLMPVVLVALGELFSPSRKFERAMTFNAWGRYAEMLRALPAVRAYVPPPQYAFLEAKALAGLGRIDEALETVRPHADDPRTPGWLYWAQLAEVFAAARMGDRVIECGEKAVALAPDNVTVLVDLAMGHLRFRRDAAAARPLLQKARAHAVSDLLAPFLTACEGVVLLEEKQPGKARPLLESALERMEPLRRTTPLMSSAIDRVHTYLAIACGQLGDSTAAERHYRQAEPRLKAFAAEDLLDRCRAVLGNV